MPLDDLNTFRFSKKFR